MDKNKPIHFIGAGGIGMSALARYFHAAGHAVTGSDLTESEITRELVAEDISVVIGPHKAANIPKHCFAVIHTAAIPEDNRELVAARKRGVPAKTYAEQIGDLTRRYHTVTISGSHGKSTTTAMTALVLESGYYDPTVILGAKIKEFGNSNFRKGKSRYFVLEADEWNRSFLHYHPTVAVVTNIDAEHLDTYGTVRAVETTFRDYLSKVPEHGQIIANKDDARARNVAKQFGKKVVWYSRKDVEAAVLRRILRVPGEHNISNALAALHAGRVFGISDPAILHALSRYTGAWRRFEFKGMVRDAYVYTDYGHHPTEIHATLAAAREAFPFRRIWCVYEPHQYARLHYLWKEFTGAFDRADRTLLLPVYGVTGREQAEAAKHVNAISLAHELQKRGKRAWHVQSFYQAKEYLMSEVRPSDVLLVMGAGTIYEFAKDLVAVH